MCLFVCTVLDYFTLPKDIETDDCVGLPSAISGGQCFNVRSPSTESHINIQENLTVPNACSNFTTGNKVCILTPAPVPHFMVKMVMVGYRYSKVFSLTLVKGGGKIHINFLGGQFNSKVASWDLHITRYLLFCQRYGVIF